MATCELRRNYVKICIDMLRCLDMRHGCVVARPLADGDSPESPDFKVAISNISVDNFSSSSLFALSAEVTCAWRIRCRQVSTCSHRCCNFRQREKIGESWNGLPNEDDNGRRITTHARSYLLKHCLKWKGIMETELARDVIGFCWSTPHSHILEKGLIQCIHP